MTMDTIAEEEGVSATQIHKDLKKAGVNGLTPDPDPTPPPAIVGDLMDTSPPPPPALPKVTGKDGKKYPATEPHG
jgi:hypothetical protein